MVINHEHTEFAWVDQADIRNYDVMAGVEEDIALLGVWPISCLNPERVPAYLKNSS